MKLQTKTILCFDAAIISVCILLGFLGYRAANNGFEAALEEKAHSDLHQAKTLLELYYPGPWYLKNGLLFKGEKQMDGAFDVVDHLSRMNGNNVTIFNGDTRVATTFPRENADSPEEPTGGQPVSESIEPSSEGFRGSGPYRTGRRKLLPWRSPGIGEEILLRLRSH